MAKGKGKGTRIRITGDKELVRKLQRLSQIGRGAALSAAVTAGAAVIVNAAQEKAPYLSGTLRRSIHAEVTTEATRAIAEIGTDVEYAAQREFGGTITAKNTPYLVFRVGGKLVRVKSVTQKATPYLRPAFDEKSDEAVSEMIAALKAAINGVV